MNRRQEESNRACTDCRGAEEKNKQRAVKKLIEMTSDSVRGILRKLCGRISPDKRIAVIVVSFVVFALVNIWVMSSAIFNIGRESEHFEHITLPEIAPAKEETSAEPDSLQLELEKFFMENFNLERDDTGTEQ